MPGAFSGPERWSSALECADVDQDGDLDLFVANGGGWSAASVIQYPHQLLINRPELSQGIRLADESVERLGQNESGAQGVTTGDVDGDGWVDALFNNCFDGRPPGLYINRGASSPGFFAFEGVERGLDSALHSYAAQFGDLDDDGDVDLVLSDSTTFWDELLAGAKPVLGRLVLYENDGRGCFTKVGAPRWNPPIVGGTQDIVLADIDGDWRVDVLAGQVSFEATHTLMHNQGAGMFVDASERLPHGGPGTFELEAGDLDGDLDIDLFTLGLEIGASDFWKVKNGVLRSDLGPAGGVSFNALPGAGSWDVNEVVLFDLDCNGSLDAFVGVLGEPADVLYKNDGTGRFRVEAGALPNGLDPQDPTVDCTVADLDNDGRYDYVVASGEYPQTRWTNLLYKNTGPRDELPPRVLAEREPLAFGTRGPWVIHARVQDQVIDDGRDWLSSVATYRVTDSQGHVHAARAAGTFEGSCQVRFALVDPAAGAGRRLSWELSFTDWAGNTTTTATRSRELGGGSR